jgi:hypothetical protein
MAGYAGIVARMAQLDSTLLSVDPTWQSLVDVASGIAGSTASGQAIDSNSPFAGVLQDVSSGQSTSGADKYANTIYGGIRVMGGYGLAFTSPLPGGRLTQGFGPTSLAMEPAATVNGVRYAHYHAGIDLARPLGTPVLAAANGTVIFAGRLSDGAEVVKIRHDDGMVSLYGHLNTSLDVKAGDRVTRGQEIGVVGMTGHTTGPHLHFALYTNGGKAVDPSTYLTSGRLPELGNVMAPSATLDRGSLTSVPGQTALADFDKIAASIPYANQIRAAAVRAGIDPMLLASLVRHESNFKANAVSSCGARGLTQLMPKTAKALGVTNSNDPQQNLDAGARYLAIQMKRFGRVDMALAAYNDGAAAVAKSGIVGSTQGYVTRILRTWTDFQEAAA